MKLLQDFSFSYTDSWMELYLLELEVDNIDDDYIVDEVMNFAHVIEDKKVDKILERYFSKGTITKKQREYLLNIYKLAYCDLGVEID